MELTNILEFSTSYFLNRRANVRWRRVNCCFIAFELGLPRIIIIPISWDILKLLI